MIVTVLSENTTSAEALGSEHGLSLYIETGMHTILFDTGASGLFAENAQKIGIDLKKVDVAVISHGHYDHGGGLQTFLGINHQAKVYLHQNAFEKHYANRSDGAKAYIGLDEALLPNDRFVFCGDRFVIDRELELFSHVEAQRLVPSFNANLLMIDGDAFVRDDFSHEQNLVIRENGKTMLIAGCAHAGIVNIVDQFKADNGCLPDFVIGGFHLYNHGTKHNEAANIVDEIGHILLDTHAQYFTCHCTGKESFTRLQSVMQEQIHYLSTGEQLVT